MQGRGVKFNVPTYVEIETTMPQNEDSVLIVLEKIETNLASLYSQSKKGYENLKSASQDLTDITRIFEWLQRFSKTLQDNKSIIIDLEKVKNLSKSEETNQKITEIQLKIIASLKDEMNQGTLIPECFSRSNVETPKCICCCDIPKLGPIFQCQNGHLICESCYGWMFMCPKCEAKLLTPAIRNLFAENVVRMGFN